MKPKQLFRVVCKGGKLRYAQRGGGTFSQRASAIDRVYRLRRQGADARLYVTACDWQEVEVPPEPSRVRPEDGRDIVGARAAYRNLRGDAR